MTAPLQVSASLRAAISRASTADPEIVAGYMSGEITTRPAGAYHNNRAGRRLHGRFTRPRYQRSPDREKSIRRRRTLAATWPMPPTMAAQLTTSQLAYARLIADEVAQHGVCDRTLDELAARGGMCRKTAKRAQDRIDELGWITVEERKVDGRKNLPNVVRIVSPEWCTWIEMGPRPRRSIGGHSCPTTDNQFLTKSARRNTDTAEKSKGAFRGRDWARSGPRDASEWGCHGT